MNIILATDNNFVQHCCVTMTSILRFNKNVNFYILTEGLTSHNVSLLTNHVTSMGGALHICKVESSVVEKFPMPSFMSDHISIATYYRLFSAEILPNSVDKAIYLDCDIVVNASLSPLWNTNIDDYALGAVYQSHEHNKESYKRLNIPSEDGYFNAGVLLINLAYWRKNNVTERLLNFVRDNYKIIHSHDQDVLNAVLHKESLVLDYIWNYRECFFDKIQHTYPTKVDYNTLDKEPVIIHYVSKPKPWSCACTHPYKKYYYEVLKQTPFRGYKPKFVFKDYYQYILKPLLVKFDILKIRRLIKN